MPKKQKSLYVNEKDAPVWKEAKRLIAFHEGLSLSAYLTELVGRVLRNFNNHPHQFSRARARIKIV
jgi:hypothetical protein